MPELPEVTTIINTLKNTSLLNNEIVDVVFYKTKVLKNCTPNQFKDFLKNESFIDIQRKGKYLIFYLTNDKFLLIHLRMEGKLFYQPLTQDIHKKHLMVQINLKNNYFLGYYDSRMFGTFHIYKSKDDLLHSKEISKISYDPFEKEMTPTFLYKKLSKCSRSIKTSLMDQSIISGIGNIYANEILFECKINPLTKSSKLTINDCSNIIKFAKQIMSASIKHKGTTIFSYKFDKTHTGEFQSFLKIHTHSSEPCPICKTLIKKIKVNGRGTYYCPNCQKEVK